MAHLLDGGWPRMRLRRVRSHWAALPLPGAEPSGSFSYEPDHPHFRGGGMAHWRLAGWPILMSDAEIVVPGSERAVELGLS